MLEVRIVLTSFAMSPKELVERVQVASIASLPLSQQPLLLDSHKHWVILSMYWYGTWDMLRAFWDKMELNCNCHLIATDNNTFVNEDYGIQPISV